MLIFFPFYKKLSMSLIKIELAINFHYLEVNLVKAKRRYGLSISVQSYILKFVNT